MAQASQPNHIRLRATLRYLRFTRRSGIFLAQVAGGICLAVLLIFGINTRIVRPTFVALASSQSLEENQRALAGLSAQLRWLTETACSWANSGGISISASFFSGDNSWPETAESIARFENSGFDLLGIYDRDRHDFRYRAFHPGLRRGVRLDRLADPASPLLRHLRLFLPAQEGLEGLIDTDQGLLLLVAQPIMAARDRGASGGMLILGRFVTPALLQTLSSQTGVAMTLTTREQLPPAEVPVFEQLAGTPASMPPLHQGDWVYQLLRDFDQQPVALLHTPARTDIDALGQRTGQILTMLLSAIALALLLASAIHRYRCKIAKEVLEHNETRFRQLFEAESDAILVIENSDGRILEANQAAIALYRYSRRELLSKRNIELSAEPEETGRINRIPAYSGEVIAVPLRWHRKKDGTVFPVEIKARFLEDKGKPIQVAAIRDISERRRMEEERAELENLNWQLQKEESLGRMAGAISHHFNNQLMMVMGYIQFALDSKQTSAQCTGDLKQAMQAAARAADISQLIRTYLGQTTSVRAPLDLAGVCQLHIPMLRSLAPAKVAIRAELPTPGPVARLNSKQIHQILTSLVTNSIESMAGGGGWVEVSVGTVEAAAIPEWRRFPAGWKPKRSGHACLIVADNGSGIEEQHIEKLFDPFFTSKFTGRGLGLAVSLGLIRAHDGVIVVESKPGWGSVFRVFLPLSDDEPLSLADLAAGHS